ncbi:MAG: PRC-barrel domain-containing protein [Steroidobacteraceae bacterium]
MNRSNIIVGISVLLLLPIVSSAQVAGSTLLGVAAAEMREVTYGWSAKRQVLGKPVYNDKNQVIGKIDDVIVAPDKAISYAIIGAGGFLGVDRHDVAIPVSQIKLQGGKLVLPGASKQTLEAQPNFEYAPPQSGT